jgi:long-chain fatty acid transport protein
MKDKRRATLALTAVLALTVLPSALHATNGMYPTSYGAEAMGRAGANLAISDRSLALNFNPAGISQLQGRHFTVNLSLLAPSLEYRNTINDTFKGKDNFFPLPAFAYVRSAKDSPWSFGVGFVAQGGMGATFEHENTFFGTVDETFTEVRFMTLSPTAAYAISEDMAIGATLNLGYADASFRFFPETSFFNTQDPAQSFFGVDMERAGGLQTNLRLGWWWRAHPRLSLGLIYQTETDSEYRDGGMTVNFEGHPFLGKRVGYSADMDGFTFAAQQGLGISYRPAEKWVLDVDIKRYLWDDAMDTILVTATDPDTPGAPPEIVMPFVFNWRDQWVLAAGFDYRYSDLLTLRAGVNYGENPVPDETLTPLFPATVERHFNLGASFLVGGKVFHLAVERAFDQDPVNNNLDPMVNPFGPGSRVGHDQWSFGFGLSWALDRKGAGTTKIWE